ncbi:ZIP family metal transporter [Portibacter marinus]|uniref:ZIP family metal transporter n=1 Tax=Portibacter marinus TaxID=2898660 RepID=UPI001F220A64|nr:ZIP family metal transporter [Portibacter marinus]
MNILPYIALFLSAIIGGALGTLLQREKSTQYLLFVLPLSGAFLLGVAVLHMLPEIFYRSEWDHKIGVLILGGFLLQNILEFLSRGVEHGHIHVRDKHNKLYIFSIMFGLCAHAFIEGLPVAHMSVDHLGHGHSLISRPYLWGIVAHKLPAAIALSILLVASKVSKMKVYLLLLVFAAMSPLGTLISEIVSFSAETQRIILAISIGFILHIATTIIFETDVNSHHQISYRKIFAVAIGFGLAFLSLL